MFNKLNYIELSGELYPIKCDMLVLEQIQDKYNDISEFENGITGFRPKIGEDGLPERNEEGLIIGMSGVPDIKMLKDGLIWMIREGMDIEKEEGKKERPELTDKQIMRKVDIPPKRLGKILHDEFNCCFARKNGETTQSPTTENQSK